MLVDGLTILYCVRADWLEKRELLKEMKERLAQIEDEITDERAELVATSGILDSNDKLRQQVQVGIHHLRVCGYPVGGGKG